MLNNRESTRAVVMPFTSGEQGVSDITIHSVVVVNGTSIGGGELEVHLIVVDQEIKIGPADLNRVTSAM
jgi:hypothetical protein